MDYAVSSRRLASDFISESIYPTSVTKVTNNLFWGSHSEILGRGDKHLTYFKDWCRTNKITDIIDGAPGEPNELPKLQNISVHSFHIKDIRSNRNKLYKTLTHI